MSQAKRNPRTGKMKKEQSKEMQRATALASQISDVGTVTEEMAQLVEANLKLLGYRNHEAINGLPETEREEFATSLIKLAEGVKDLATDRNEIVNELKDAVGERLLTAVDMTPSDRRSLLKELSEDDAVSTTLTGIGLKASDIMDKYQTETIPHVGVVIEYGAKLDDEQSEKGDE